MEMDYVSEFPHSHMDRRPRKRPRLAREIPQAQLKAHSGMYFGQDVGNGTGFGPSRVLPDHASLFVKGLAQKGSPPWRNDDKDGHYMFALRDNLTSHYKIHRKIGEGTFGQVLECWDRETREMVAIKVVRSIKKYREAAMIEIDVLQLLGKYDRNGSRLHPGHRKREPTISGCQSLVQLRLLILAAQFMSIKITTTLSLLDITVHLRLFLGEALFQTHENLEHLAMMERILGPLPPHMLKRADRHAEKYVRKGRLDWPEGAASRESIKSVMKLARLQNLVMQHVDHSAGDLIDLLQSLLRYDPSNRLTACETLGHPFFMRDHYYRKFQ